MKKIIPKYGSLLLAGMALMNSANALTRYAFQVASTGAATTARIELCLSAGTSAPNSQSGCERFTVTGSTLQIRTTIPGKLYANLGIKVLSSGYTVQGGLPYNSATGYYVFSANNTADTTVTLASTTANATISISSPTQANQFMTVPSAGISPTDLILAITNDAGSEVNATNITVTDKTNCPNLSVTASTCASLGIGQTCNLTLSSNTPYVPCTISIKGTNTNTLTTTVAFQYLDGWVFEGNGTVGKVVRLSQFYNEWTVPSANVGANSATDGVANTNAIVGNPSCNQNSTRQAKCAAYQCRNIASNWYLPAKDELNQVYTQISVNGFGGFSTVDAYWSSTQYNGPDPTKNQTNDAWSQLFSTGQQAGEFKFQTSVLVRCVRSF